MKFIFRVAETRRDFQQRSETTVLILSLDQQINHFFSFFVKNDIFADEYNVCVLVLKILYSSKLKVCFLFFFSLSLPLPQILLGHFFLALS